MECPPPINSTGTSPTGQEEEVECRLGRLVLALSKQLTPDDIRKFAACLSDVDRIAFLLEKLEIGDLSQVTAVSTDKDAAQSESFRSSGNALFAKRQFKQALEAFNESVSLAPFFADDPVEAPDITGPVQHTASSQLLAALANRSAALQFLKKYDLSVRDIDLALRRGYGKEQRYKLYDRRGKCLNCLGRREEAAQSFRTGLESLGDAQLDEQGRTLWTESFNKQLTEVKSIQGGQKAKREQAAAAAKRTQLPSLTGGKSKRFECTSEAFDIAMTSDKGRGVVCPTGACIGDVLAIEEAYASVVYASHRGERCYHCNARMVAPLPCRGCAMARFCSEKCGQQAWDVYHYAECRFMSCLSEFWLTKLGHLAMRITMSTPYETLRHHFCSNRASSSPEPLSTASGFTEGIYRSNYDAVFHLCTSGDLRLPDGLLSFSVMSVLMLEILRQSARYWQASEEAGDAPTEAHLIVATSIMHHMQVVQCNAMTIAGMDMSPDFRQCHLVDVGLGLYPTLSLLNHSCDANVELVYYGGIIVARAVRDVKPGDPLITNYGMCYHTNTKAERKMYFQLQFYFDCQCEACREDWPLWEQIESRVPTLLCENCGGDLPRTSGPGKLSCPSCKTVVEIGQVLHRLQVSHELFSLAMKDTMEGRYDAALPILEEHLRLMQTYIKQPWRDFVSCQATIKQIYNIYGYNYM